MFYGQQIERVESGRVRRGAGREDAHRGPSHQEDGCRRRVHRSVLIRVRILSSERMLARAGITQSCPFFILSFQFQKKPGQRFAL